jgi:hypothetical protein
MPKFNPQYYPRKTINVEGDIQVKTKQHPVMAVKMCCSDLLLCSSRPTKTSH